MPRKSVTKTTKFTKSTQPVAVEPAHKTGFFDYLQFGESYTSLILGIVAVIIATVMLLSFVHNKNVSSVKSNATQVASQNNNNNSQKLAQVSQAPTATPTVTPTPTVKPTEKLTPTPTVVKKAQPTVAPKKIAVASSTPTKANNKILAQKDNTAVTGSDRYVVVEGDNLWTIAEKTYKSGYNWIDIARANNLTNPDDIHSGNVLVLPKVAPKVATLGTGVQNNSSNAVAVNSNSITGTTYTIQHGDTLWSIAVRAYGDGYKWESIAQANNLSANPGLIHAGNTIKIPRA